MVLIIGAGPVGIHTASLLLHEGYSVTIVEAGTFENESQLLSRDSYVFNSKSAMPKGAHRVGGGSNYWHARFGEFNEEDFSNLENLGIPGWPFSKKSLLKFYKSVALEISGLGLSDDEFVDMHFAELLDVIPSDLDLKLFRFANNYSFINKLYTLQENSNLKVLTGLRVDSISVSNNPNQPGFNCHATGIDNSVNLYSNCVIVCAGTLQSTRIILNSNLFEDPVTKNLVGLGLMEHLEGFVGTIRVKKKHGLNARRFKLTHNNRVEGLNAGVGIKLNSGVQSRFDLPSMHLELRPRPREIKSSRLILEGAFINPVHYLERIFKALCHFANESLDLILDRRTFGIWVKCEEFRNIESKLKQSLKNDSGSLIYDHQISQLTFEKFYESLELLIPKAAEFFKGEISLFGWVNRKEKRNSIGINWHPMGTLPMGTDANSSICDEDLQVHNNKGLYLLSPAVFNRGSNGNPTFTTLALASKLVEEIFKNQTRLR